MHRNRARWMRDVMSGRRIWTIEDSGMRYDAAERTRRGLALPNLYEQRSLPSAQTLLA